MHRTKSIATYVHRIINIRLQWRAIVDAERYIWYIRLSCTSLANMAPPSSHAYIRYALKYRVLLHTYTIIMLHPNCPTTY